jgi:predicted TIM-barrel fold metal-dependent hydrolase
VLIADAQVHVWGPNTPERPWRGGQVPHRDALLGADELLREMDAASVARALLVPPYWEADRDDVVTDAVLRHPQRFGAMGRPDTETPQARVPLSTWLSQPGVRCLRCSFGRPRQLEVLEGGELDWLWADAEAGGVPVMVLIPHSHARLLGQLAERHPRLELSLCHLGLTSHQYDAVAFRDLDNVIALAKHPNICVNASALPAYTKDSYPYRRLHPYLRRVYDAFGPRRIFWGSDYSRLPCTYAQAVTMFTEEIPWLSAEDKAWIMGRGLCKWLGWSEPDR